MGEPELLKIGDVATRFNVSTETVRGWVRRGKLTAVKTPTGQLRFQREVIETALTAVPAPDDDAQPVSA